MTVKFDEIDAASVEILSPTSARVVTPAHPVGFADVHVTVGILTFTRNDAFEFTQPAPTVSSVSPNQGPAAGGTPISVAGSGFLQGATVSVGGSPATGVAVTSGGSINAISPPGPFGPAAVVVTNADGQAGSISGGFTYLAPNPSVTSLSPSSGAANGGTIVTITGSNFLAGATVAFGTSPATGVTVNSGTSISATTPPGSGTVNVLVTNPGGAVGVLFSGFTYAPAPVVTAVSPNTGPLAGGTEVTIQGLNFQPGATVQFGGAAAPVEGGEGARGPSALGVEVVSSTTILARTPSNGVGSKDLTVTNPDGQSGSLEAGFTYEAGPTITAISPNSGPPNGGTSAAITGTGFQAGASVTVGGAAASSVTVVSDVLINIFTPAGAGAADVVVTNPDGQSATASGAFIYGGAPTVASITPNVGLTAGGTAVTVVGTNFQTGATVTLGGVAAVAVTVVNPSQMTLTTPPGAIGSVDVVINNPFGGSVTVTNGFTYVPPNITSVTPNTGGMGGGTVITILGSNFEVGAAVTIGGVSATGITVVNSTTITATTPLGAAGPQNVQVINPSGGGGLLPNGFTYMPPSIVSVTPNTGGQAGGTVITIVGSFFEVGAAVTIGGVSATGITVVNSTTITATTPLGAVGAQNVQVTNLSGGVALVTNGFTYVPPSITTITANRAFVSGGIVVTITGVDFEPGATVAFGGIAGTGVTVVGPTTITVTVPAAASAAGGAVNVVVTNPSTTSATLTNGFTYDALPIIATVTPNSGFASGGTVVTITGQFFAAGATVTVGGAAVTGVTVVNATTITFTTLARPAGTVSVVVTNSNGGSDTVTGAYTFVPPPTVASLTPAIGGTVGGLVVTITGTNFVAGAAVTIGGAAATAVTVVSPTTITATTPPGALGTANVVVTNPDTQASTLANAFTYVLLQVTGLSRDVSSTSGATTMSVFGAGFVNGAGVTFGGAAATGVVFNSSNSLTVINPPHAAGFVNVVVTNPDLSNATFTNGFEYLPAPSVTYISHDFDDGTFGAFQSFATPGNISVGNWGAGKAVSGSQAVRAQVNAGTASGTALLQHNYSPAQPANQPGGVYQRWYIQLDQQTITAVRSGQIKLLLNRSQTNPPSWLHIGIGPQFPNSGQDQIGVLSDYNTGNLPGNQSKTGFVTVADQWIELQTYYFRTGGVGRARFWINGKNYVDVSNANFGTDAGSPAMSWSFAIDFTQQTVPGGFLTMYVDNAAAKNGYIDP